MRDIYELLTDEDKAELQAYIEAEREVKRLKQSLLTKKWYVYLLLDEGVPFYAGKGSGMRMFMHEKETQYKLRRCFFRDTKPLTAKERKIANMLARGRKIGYRIVLRTNSEREAYRVENDYINTTPGLLNTKRKGAAREDWERRLEITRKFMEKVRRNRATSN